MHVYQNYSYLKNGSEIKLNINSHEANIPLAVGLCGLIVLSLGGNILVCVAVCTDRHLRKRSNSLYVSLAVADLLLSMLVMTFSVANELVGHWKFTKIFCNIYLSMDVMCCTASILNILSVAIDRYEHIRNPFEYDHRMTRCTFVAIIAFIWIFSALISFIPIHLGWHKTLAASDQEHFTGTATASSSVVHYDISDQKFECTLELNAAYAIISSSFSFFLPCTVMVILYIRLYKFAMSHAKRLAPPSGCAAGDSTRFEVSSMTADCHSLGPSSSVKSTIKSRRYVSSDHKAAVTLGVIMGTFLICWLPFFIINCISSFCGCISKYTFFLATWLGYFNSCLNPIIYSLLNLEFRNAFKKILCRSCSQNNQDFYNLPRRSNHERFILQKSASMSATSSNQPLIKATCKIAQNGELPEAIKESFIDVDNEDPNQISSPSPLSESLLMLSRNSQLSLEQCKANGRDVL